MVGLHYKMSNIDDRKIIEGIIADDDAVIEKFYRDHLPHVRNYILQNSGSEDDVGDVFHDALMVIYQKIGDNSLEITSSLKTYFFAICRNMWLSRLRVNKRYVMDDTVLTNIEGEDVSIQETIENSEKEHIYRKYFLTLSDACQKVLSMVFLDKTMREIAAETGYSEGYARKKKYECKQALMERIEKDPMYKELKKTTED